MKTPVLESIFNKIADMNMNIEVHSTKCSRIILVKFETDLILISHELPS